MADEELDPQALARKYGSYAGDMYPDQGAASSYNQEEGFDGGYQPPKQNYVTADGSDQSKPAPAAYKGFNPNSFMMRQYAQTATDYKDKAQAGEVPGTYLDTQGGKAVGRNEPQQFGQQGSIVDPDEGPFTPEQTANLIQQKGGIEQLAKSHTLPMLAPERQKGYEKYVTLSRAKDLEDKQQRALRAQANQSADAGKDARMWQQMADTNALQNGQQPGQGQGMGGVMAMGGRAVGPLFFHGGHYRPMDTMEQAHAGLLNAQAGWMNDRGNTMRDVAGIRADALLKRAREGTATRMDLEELKQMGYDNRKLMDLGVKIAGMEQKGDQFKANQDRLNQRDTANQQNRKAISDALQQLRQQSLDIKKSGNQQSMAQHEGNMLGKATNAAEMLRIKMAGAAAKPGRFWGEYPEDLSKLDETIDQNKQGTGKQAEGDFDAHVMYLDGVLKTMLENNPNVEVDQGLIDTLNQAKQMAARRHQSS